MGTLDLERSFHGFDIDDGEDVTGHADTENVGTIESEGEEAFECPDCGRLTVYEWRLLRFIYGIGEDACEISVRVPMFCCNECDLQFLGSLGAELKHEAVCRHLGILSPKEIRSLRTDQSDGIRRNDGI